MLGIALEGGGAKGAFHMGALQACVETGNIPAAIAGTSIGAMNAAMFAQGDFEKALELWQRVSGSDVFTPDMTKNLYTPTSRSLISKALSASWRLSARCFPKAA